MTLLDPIELGEARAERLLDRFKGNIYTCSCGNKCTIDQIEILTPDPYGEPFCPKCVEKYLEELKRSNPTAYDRYFGNFDNG